MRFVKPNGYDVIPNVPVPTVPRVGETVYGPSGNEAWQVTVVHYDYLKGYTVAPVVQVVLVPRHA